MSMCSRPSRCRLSAAAGVDLRGPRKPDPPPVMAGSGETLVEDLDLSSRTRASAAPISDSLRVSW